LAADETEAAFTVVMQGHASEAQMRALLMSPRAKGETPHEVMGGVRALRRAMATRRQASSSQAQPSRWRKGSNRRKLCSMGVKGSRRCSGFGRLL